MSEYKHFPQDEKSQSSPPRDANAKVQEMDSAPPRTLKQFLFFVWDRIRKEGKWWLVPLWILLVILAVLLVLSGNGALLPAIYLAF